jgi:hypothetical protein
MDSLLWMWFMYAIILFNYFHVGKNVGKENRLYKYI